MIAFPQMMSLRGALSGCLVIAAVCLGGCAETLTNAKPDIAQPSAVRVETSPATEREHQRILLAYGGIYEDAKLEALLTGVVDRLVAASERPDLSYRVTILNSPTINAFALPNGAIYVTRGLLALANDTSEVASVLAHEMAHVIARHAAIREDQARQAAIVSTVVSDVLSDPEIGALALAKSRLALASFSRAQEFEADGIGVGIAARAGFDPFGAPRFLSAMGRNAELRPTSKGGTPAEFLASHPATPERVRNAQMNARQFSAPSNSAQDRQAYAASLNGLVYGEDPVDGLVRGRRYVHPRLGITFTAPDGFELDNTAHAVLGLKEGGRQALRIDVAKAPAEQPMTDYLAAGWIENVDPKSIQPVTVNGLQGATATARGEQWSFRLYALRQGEDVYRIIFAAKSANAEADRDFRDSVQSFRRLTAREVRNVKPLRLSVITAKPGDRVEALAQRMPAGFNSPERLRVLNGLAAGQQVRPGDPVKIITD